MDQRKGAEGGGWKRIRFYELEDDPSHKREILCHSGEPILNIGQLTLKEWGKINMDYRVIMYSPSTYGGARYGCFLLHLPLLINSSDC